MSIKKSRKFIYSILYRYKRKKLGLKWFIRFIDKQYTRQVNFRNSESYLFSLLKVRKDNSGYNLDRGVSK